MVTLIILIEYIRMLRSRLHVLLYGGADYFSNRSTVSRYSHINRSYLNRITCSEIQFSHSFIHIYLNLPITCQQRWCLSWYSSLFWHKSQQGIWLDLIEHAIQLKNICSWETRFTESPWLNNIANFMKFKNFWKNVKNDSFCFWLLPV